MGIAPCSAKRNPKSHRIMLFSDYTANRSLNQHAELDLERDTQRLAELIEVKLSTKLEEPNRDRGKLSSRQLDDPSLEDELGMQSDTHRLAGLIEVKLATTFSEQDEDIQYRSSRRLAELIEINKAAKYPTSFSESTSRISPTYLTTDLDETSTNQETTFNFPTPTQILTTLFLGSKDDSLKEEKLKQIGITHILSVVSGHQNIIPGCKHLSAPMADKGYSDVKSIIKEVFPFMEEGQRDGNKLLVHCHLGQNRSPTIVIAYLMKYEELTLWSAHKLVKAERPLIHPHPSYIKQLREYNKELWGLYSTPANFLALSVLEGDVNIAHEFMSSNDSSIYMLSQVSLAPPGSHNSKRLPPLEESSRQATDESSQLECTPVSKEKRLRSSRLNIPPISMNLGLPLSSSEKFSGFISITETKETDDGSSDLYETDSDSKLPTFIDPNLSVISLAEVNRFNEIKVDDHDTRRKVQWTI